MTAVLWTVVSARANCSSDSKWVDQRDSGGGRPRRTVLLVVQWRTQSHQLVETPPCERLVPRPARHSQLLHTYQGPLNCCLSFHS